MSITRKSLSYLSLLLLFVSSLSAKEDHRTESQPAALQEAMSLVHTGVLKQKENGFVYLDVPNEFISAVVPLLDYEGLLRSRPVAARSMGAHISVFEEKENIVPTELGDSFSFEVKEVRSFTLHSRDGLKKLWVLAVHSPELEQLRQNYGCSPKLKGFDFHITLGKQMPGAPEDWEDVDAFSSFNYSDEPVEGISSKGDFVVVENKQIFETAAKVDAVGRLKIKGNGFVYLDVDNQYIDKVCHQLPVQGEFDPVSTKIKKMGAHISVIHEDEMIGHELWSFAELGEKFTFEVKELRYVDRKTPKGKVRLWLLAVDCPALERLRSHYGLKPKLQGHDFHITLGNEQLESAKVTEDDDGETEEDVALAAAA